jgi:LPXTG-motif cell wall-anchored protein
VQLAPKVFVPSLWERLRKEAFIMDTSTIVRVLAGALAVIVLAVIIIRRKKKSA